MPPLRYLIFLVFIPGMCPGYFGIPDPGGILVASNIISAASYAVLVGGLKQPIDKTLWVWILLVIFVMGYYFKFWGTAFMMETHPEWYLEMPWLTIDDLTEGIAWTTAGFCLFCLEARLLLNVNSPSLSGRRTLPANVRLHPARFKLLLGGIIVAFLVTAAMPLVFNFGQMGVEGSRLPFRIDTLITRTRVNLIPALFLLLLWMNDNRKLSNRWLLILIIFLLSVFVDSMVRCSRSAMLLAAIPILFLWLMSDQMTPQRKQFIYIALGLTILLYPFLTALRSDRMSGIELSLESISGNQSRLDWNQIDNPEVHLYHAGTRIAGLLSLVHNLHHGDYPAFIDPQRIPWMLDYNKMLDYQTYEVVGVPRSRIDGRVPGLLGSFLLVGGKAGMLLMLAIYVWLSWSVWQMLRKISIAPVTLALFGTFYILHTAEGTHGVQIPIAWAVSIWMTCLVYRWLVYCPQGMTQLKHSPIRNFSFRACNRAE